MTMENNMAQTPGLPPEELSALARIFGEFLRKRSFSHHDIMAEAGRKIVTARNAGDSFITLNGEAKGKKGLTPLIPYMETWLENTGR